MCANLLPIVFLGVSEHIFNFPEERIFNDAHFRNAYKRIYKKDLDCSPAQILENYPRIKWRPKFHWAYERYLILICA